MTVREADLLSIYALYPRKVDKSDGMKVLRLTVKTLDDLELCRRAVTNFAQAMKGQEARFIRHFGRWAKSWRDWIGEEDELPLLRVAKGTERLSPIPKPSGPVVERDEVRAMAEMLVGRLRGVK
jgi:hypothetical protein